MPFTRMPGDSDLRRPPPKIKHVCQNNIFIQIHDAAPEIKGLLRKIVCYLLHTCNKKQTYNFYLVIEVPDHVHVLVGKI